MDTFQAIKSRRSVRKFKSKKIPDEILYAIFEAGHAAPSAGNFCNWRFFIVEDEEQKESIANAAYKQEWIAKAPVVVIVCSVSDPLAREYGSDKGKVYAIQNVAAAIENILLAAHNFGVASCWVGAFNESKLKNEFEIPDDTEIQAIVPLGYADEKPVTPDKPDFSTVLYFRKWEEGKRKESKTIGVHAENIQEKISKKVNKAVEKIKSKVKK